ncbi:hypothetical protein M0R45_020076 [Rubus argutus]|uniref:Uncharacterized protein n=1 Tax=Rubus argutus TaxID=59490 RepID=A0AAW1X8N9_RUBAR
MAASSFCGEYCKVTANYKRLASKIEQHKLVDPSKLDLQSCLKGFPHSKHCITLELLLYAQTSISGLPHASLLFLSLASTVPLLLHHEDSSPVFTARSLLFGHPIQAPALSSS